MFKINAYNVLLEAHKERPTPTLPVREGEPTAKEGGTQETHPDPPCEGGGTKRERGRINYEDT